MGDDAMAERGVADEPSFKELERQVWGAKANYYDAFGGQITVGAVAPLLDAAVVGTDMRVLDVACIDQLKARLARTVAYLKTLDRKAIDASAEREITFPLGPNTGQMNGADYLIHFLLPN